MNYHLKSERLSADATLKIQQQLRERTLTEGSLQALQSCYRLTDRQLIRALVHATRQHCFNKDARSSIPSDISASTATNEAVDHLIQCPHCPTRLKAKNMNKHVRKAHTTTLSRMGKSLCQAIETKEEREAQRRQQGYTRMSSPVVLKPYRN